MKAKMYTHNVNTQLYHFVLHPLYSASTSSMCATVDKSFPNGVRGSGGDKMKELVQKKSKVPFFLQCNVSDDKVPDFKNTLVLRLLKV